TPFSKRIRWHNGRTELETISDVCRAEHVITAPWRRAPEEQRRWGVEGNHERRVRPDQANPSRLGAVLFPGAGGYDGVKGMQADPQIPARQRKNSSGLSGHNPDRSTGAKEFDAVNIIDIGHNRKLQCAFHCPIGAAKERSKNSAEWPVLNVDG